MSSQDDDWLTIDKHCLSYDDKAIIAGNGLLNDKIMYITQLLIKIHCCQEINGLHSPQLGKNYKFPKTSSPFIQVLHVRRNHWIVASSVNCEPGIVKIYDSLYSNIDLDTACQVASLVR